MEIKPAQFSNINLPYNKILARLNYAKGKTQIDDKTRAIIDEQIGLCKKLLHPQQVTAFSKITIDKETVKLEPGCLIHSKDIVSLLKNCSLAYGFAVTIGPHLEEKRNEYSMHNDVTKALVLDAIGSVAAEELAELANNEIRNDIEKNNIKTTRRFSPGYGDWKISGQKDFLKWLGADIIGIKLTQNYQMLPEKSVSAILGVLNNG